MRRVKRHTYFWKRVRIHSLVGEAMQEELHGREPEVQDDRRELIRLILFVILIYLEEKTKSESMNVVTKNLSFHRNQ